MQFKFLFKTVATITLYSAIGFAIYTDIISKDGTAEYVGSSEHDNQDNVVQKQEFSYQDSPLPQNDLMLIIVANPTFSLEDLVVIGINKDNVSLRDIQIYRNDPYIRSVFTDELGNLNEMRLQSIYHKATEWMNSLQSDNVQCENEPSFHRDNIFAPSEQRRAGHDYEELLKTN